MTASTEAPATRIKAPSSPIGLTASTTAADRAGAGARAIAASRSIAGARAEEEECGDGLESTEPRSELSVRGIEEDCVVDERSAAARDAEARGVARELPALAAGAAAGREGVDEHQRSLRGELDGDGLLVARLGEADDRIGHEDEERVRANRGVELLPANALEAAIDLGRRLRAEEPSRAGSEGERDPDGVAVDEPSAERRREDPGRVPMIARREQAKRARGAGGSEGRWPRRRARRRAPRAMAGLGSRGHVARVELLSDGGEL